LVPFPYISPTLDTKFSNRIYAEVHIAGCIWWLASGMDERGSDILKGEVHSLMQSTHSLFLSLSLSHSTPHVLYVLVILSAGNSCRKLTLTAHLILQLSYRSRRSENQFHITFRQYLV